MKTITWLIDKNLEGRYIATLRKTSEFYEKINPPYPLHSTDIMTLYDKIKETISKLSPDELIGTELRIEVTENVITSMDVSKKLYLDSQRQIGCLSTTLLVLILAICIKYFIS